MTPQSRSLPPCVRRFLVAAELETERLHAVVEELPSDYWPQWLPAGGGDLRLVFSPAAPGLMSSPPPGGRPLPVVAAMLLALVMTLAGCVVGPDGRVRSPVGEAVLEQVLTCSVQAGLNAAASALANRGAPDERVLIDASACHIALANEQVRRARASTPTPTVEHGRLIQRARALEDAGEHTEALDVARECSRLARGGQ